MDRDQLKSYLDRGLSLEEIGAAEERHPSTIGYWVKKYGLVPGGRQKHAPVGGITREQLEELVDGGCSQREICCGARGKSGNRSSLAYEVRTQDTSSQ